jgi:membrane protein involved in colicin uptake
LRTGNPQVGGSRRDAKDALKGVSTAKPRDPVDDGTLKPSTAKEKTTEVDKAAKAAERAARKAARDAEKEAEAKSKAEEKAAKAAAKAEKKAAKAAEKAARGPAHMKKVERARAKLAPLSDTAALVFADATCNLTAAEVDLLCAHLTVHNRAMRTISATKATQLPVGARAKITGGDPKFVGQVGEVVHSHKLRLKVAVPGIKNPVYLYTGEAELYVENEEETDEAQAS